MDDGPRSARPVGLALVAVALVATGLAALLGKSDLLTGTAAPVDRPADTCASSVGDVAPDPAPTPAGIVVPNLQQAPLPLPPISGLGATTQNDQYDYSTPADYAQLTLLPRPGPIETAMAANGFRTGTSRVWGSGPVSLGEEGLQFGSPSQAASFQRQSLVDGCRDGLITNIEPLPHHAGGYLFTVHNTGDMVSRATFLVGDTVVRAGLCVCATYSQDSFTVLSQWAGDLDARLRIPLPR